MSEDRLFKLPPVSPIKGKHPRLLINEDDIKIVLKNLNHEENIEMYKEAVRLSELPYDGILPPPSIDQNTNENDETVGCAEACAFFYLINKDLDKGKKAIGVIKNYLKTLIIKEGSDNITRHSGYAIYVASCVYDWCYDLLTDEDKVTFQDEMLRHMKRCEISWPPVKQHFITGHGVEMQTFRDALAMGVALYDEDPEIYNLIAGRIFEKMLDAKNYTNGSNLFTEGSSYGPFRYAMEIMSTLIFDKIGAKNVYSMDQLYVLYGATMYNRLPDGRFIETGDSAKYNDGFIEDASDSCFLAGNYYKDPYIRKMYFKSNPSAKNIAIGRYGVSAVLHLIVNDPSVGVASCLLPKTAYFKEPLGTIISRTDWEEGKNTDTVVVKMNAGQHSFMNHQHSDSGHFDIYYKGMLAVDSGIYTSAPYSINGRAEQNLCYGSLHDSNYNKRTIAHNCMLVFDPDETGWFDSNENDGGQTRFDIPYTMEEAADKKFYQGHPIAYDFGPDPINPLYSYLKGNLENAYTKKVEEYERTFVFLNLFDEKYPAALIVFDSIKSLKADFKKTWLLHCQNEPQIKGNEIIIDRGQGRLVNKALLPQEANITKIGGPGREFELNGKNQMAVSRSLRQESGKWRIEISPDKSSKHDYFLNVLAIGNSDYYPSFDAEIISDDNEFVGIKIKDRAVFIRKPKEKTDESFIISLPKEDKELTYIVTGLKSGKWYVKNKEQIVFEKEVSELNDSLCFTSASGEYTFEYEALENTIKSDKKHFSEYLENADYEPIDIKIDARFETFKEKPFTENETLFVCAHEYFEKLGYSYTLDTDGITAKVKNKTCRFFNDKNYAEVTIDNDVKTVSLEESVVTKNSKLFIPIANIAPYIHTEVKYFSYSKCAFVKKVGIESEAACIRSFTATDDRRVTILKGLWSSNNAIEGDFYKEGNDLNAYWSACGDNEWLKFEFTEELSVSRLEIYFKDGHLRKEKFEILISSDDLNWEKVFDGYSDGKTKGFEEYIMPNGISAKFLKIVGHGNTVNKWNQINEIIIYK